MEWIENCKTRVHWLRVWGFLKKVGHWGLAAYNKCTHVSVPAVVDISHHIIEGVHLFDGPVW